MIEQILSKTPKNEAMLQYDASTPKRVSYINPYNYIQVRNMSFIFEHFDYISSDGSLFTVLYKLLGGPKTIRLSPDLGSYFKGLFEVAAKEQHSVFFIGTKPDLIGSAVANIQDKFPSLNIVGYSSGYFSGNERSELLDHIADIQPNIVIVGMGIPIQEQFIIDLSEKGWRGGAYTCGGFLHQTAKNIDYYPKWVNDWNIRWLYRIYDEPKLLWRYAIDYPHGISLFIIDFIKFKLAK